MTHIHDTDANRVRAREVGEALLGTCNSLDDNIELVFGEGVTATDLDTTLLEEIDDITMECQVCGWWCETGFVNDEGVCEDCEEDDG